ncbi:hypothetical protein CKO11_04795 [Rhodobacter sp. TJ_12]|uniref:PAS domain S-box protein n=1 Tax=Rhodobacter sp. TJ_12 TaxID=2029399 RepID=UPI001CC13CA1|nr:PAS domain S-box protein [Rhodobacter sp. TJ_12]MBZ4021777.1 hypothetical protein [Rhodobacter sp. TJ_12]
MARRVIPRIWPGRQLFYSLKNRIILLTLGAVFVTAVLIAGSFYVRISQLARDAAVTELAGETRLLAQSFKTAFSQMKHDGQVLASTPQIPRIIRAYQGPYGRPGQVAPHDTWGPQLSSIFQSVMQRRAHYTQMRLLGADGQELVRVNRTEDGFEFVPAGALQNKSAEPYVRESIGLQPGQIYFSEVTYNREHGQVEETHTPTIRVVIPIFSDTGPLSALLVINANYAHLLQQQFDTIAPDKQTFLVNNLGDYVQSTAETGMQPFEMRGNYSAPPPAIVTKVQAIEENDTLLVGEDQIAYFVRLNLDASDPRSYLGIIVQMSKDEFRAPAQQTLMLSLLLGIFFLAVSLVISFHLARRFMRPLLEMTQKIEAAKGHTVPNNLPIDRHDEIGALARAFKARAHALLDSEAQARAILENMFDGLVTLDRNGVIQNCNASCARIFGYPEHELLGKGIHCLFPDFAQQGVALQASLNKTQRITARHKDGRDVTVEFSVGCVDLGRRSLYSCIMRDVSEQHRMRIALETLEERWALALDAAQIGVFDVDLQTQKTIVSDIWCQILGLPADAEVDAQEEWEKRIHPDDRDLVLAANQACFEGRAQSAVTEHRLRHNDGRWIWLRTFGRVTKWGENSAPLRFVGVQMDISGLKMAEAALKASEERLRMAIDNAPIAMALLDLEGNWIKVNEAICLLLGYDQNELLRLNSKDVTVQKSVENNVSQMQRLVQGEIDTYEEEKCYLRKDGSSVWGRVSVSVARDTEGQPAYFIKQILDISQQRETERLQSEFISTVNHELRTPLTSIQGSLAILQAKLAEKIDDKEMRLLANSHESCQRLSRLVNDILDVQQIRQGKIEYNFAAIDVCQLVEDVVESHRPMTDKFGVEIETVLPNKALPLWVDPDRLTQAVINVVSNAAKFSERGDKIILSVSERANNSVRIAVKDFGPGISEAFRSRLFSQFAQADGSSKRNTEGSGLGLNITKSLVEEMGGQIDYETEEGKGTTFFFDFPIFTLERKSA